MDIPTVTNWIEPQRRMRILRQSLVAWVVIALLTWFAFALHISLATVSSLYLLVVVAVAAFGGFWQASLASVLAVACLDYFFMPPLFGLSVADPQDWIALGAFEATALVISRLSAKELRSARDAAIHRAGMEQLYELSRSSLWMDLHQPLGPQLVVLIQRIFGAHAVAMFDKNLRRQDRVGHWAEDEQDIARECWMRNAGGDDRETETSRRILHAASGSVGALVVRGKLSPLVVDALASLVAMAIDRHQSFEKEEQADAARRGEQLRAAVMDSLAHEFKTPLTTVQTASSGLLEVGGLTGIQQDLARLIEGEAVRLSELCTKLLLTAKLETHQVGLQTNEANIQELISEAMASQPAKEIKSRIEVAVEDPALSASVDRGLLTLILTQYIDNARKYSDPNSPIKIGARMSRSELVISVHNSGPVIRIEDRERIFDRFYRAQDMKDSIPGTGIGLSVVRKAAEAHHGHAWVISDDKEGTTFFVSLPIEGGRNR